MRPHKWCAGCARDIAYAGRWTQGGRTVGNANAIGRAGHPHPSHPGNPATAGRRGRRPLRVADKRRYQHRGKQMRKGNHLRPSLGSPERGAVAALCAVTEGLVQRGCGMTTLQVIPRRGGRGGGRVEPTSPVIRRAAHRGRCALRRVGNVSALQLRHPSSNERGVEDAAPYGGCVWVGFSGAVKWTGSLGAVSRGRYDVCCNFGYAVARRVHRPRCTVAAGLPGWVRRIR